MPRTFLVAISFWIAVWPVCVTAQLRWEMMGEMSVPRAMHAATNIGDDLVIAIGGRTEGDQTTNTTDIIDLRSGTIQPGPAMTEARAQFAMVRMTDGRIVVGGGYTNGFESNTDLVEIFDAKTMKWSSVGRLREARGQFSGIEIDDDHVLFVGGRIQRSNVRATCEIVQISTGTSLAVQDFPYPTEGTRLIKTVDGSILAFSGRSGGPGSFRSDIIHRFNVQKRVWEKAGFVADSLYLPEVTRLDDGSYLWTGGSFAESDSKSTFSSTIGILDGRSFVKIGDMVSARVQHRCTQISDSICVATGGEDDWKNSQFTCDLINVRSGVSRLGPRMHVARAMHAQADVVIEGIRTCIVIGGYDTTAITPLVEVLRDGCPNGSNVPLLDFSALNLVGSAAPSLGAARLTPAVPFQAGAIWQKNRQVVDKGFVSTFVFRMSQGSDGPAPDGGSPGADGVAFVIQNENASPVGVEGGGIGYEGLPHGVVVEFDAYLNGNKNDVAGSHVAVQVGDGTVLSAVHRPPYTRMMTFAGVPQLIANGSLYYAKIEYAAGVLRVWIDTDGSFSNAVIELPIDLRQELSLSNSGTAWVGITSSTGVAFQSQEIVAWYFGECEYLLTSLKGEITPEQGTDVKVWPIPASGLTQVSWDDDKCPRSITIHDMSGNEISRFSISSGEGSSFQFDATNYASGLYMISIDRLDRVEKRLLPVLR